jgi:hypothetical protein
VPERLLQWLEPLLLGVLAGCVAWQLFVSPLVGMADNGDYGRIIATVGIAYAEPPENENAWIVRSYVPVPRDDWSGYRSSALLLAEGTKLADHLLTRGARIDLRMMGAIHFALFLLGAAALLYGLRACHWPVRLTMGAFLVLVLSDVGYAAWLNSFYSEAASLVFALLTLGLALVAITRGDSLRSWYLLSGAYILAALLFITAKPQNAVLSLPLALLLVRLASLPVRGPRRDYRLPLALAAAMLLVVSSVVYLNRGSPPAFRSANLYNMVFAEILPHSTDPEADLRALGLNPALAGYRGTTAYTPDVPINSIAARAELFHNLDQVDILRFYAARPGRFLDLAERGAGSAFVLRPHYLGNHEREAGFPAYAQSDAFDWWSELRSRLLPGTLWFLLPMLGVHVVVAGWGWRSAPGPRLRLLAELHLVILALACLQFGVVLLGEGEFEIVKHLFLFNLMVDLALACLAGWSVMAATAIKRQCF